MALVYNIHEMVFFVLNIYSNRDCTLYILRYKKIIVFYIIYNIYYMLLYIIIFIILLYLFWLFINNKQIKQKEDFAIIEEKDIKYTPKKFKKSEKVNNMLIKTQFDRNYRDVINAFNIIAPSQKSMFNQDDLKEEYIRVDRKELKKIMNSFIEQMNKIIIDEVSDNRTNLTGWNSLLPEKKIQSGWEKQMESLGLPQNLYHDPVKKSTIRIILIGDTYRIDTINEIKYVCFLILQKNNIDEQIFIKISFIITKGDKNKDVIIEEIFIIGFIINENKYAVNNSFDKFYNFNGLNNTMEAGVTTSNQQLTMLRELSCKLDKRLEESYKFSENIKKNEHNASTC